MPSSPLPQNRVLGSCFALALIATSSLAQQPSRVTVPRDIGQERMQARQAAQEASAGAFKVFRGFGFTDRLEDSGIAFRSRIVDDVGRDYKMVHYDHGNGIVVADVDGDRRLDLYLLTQAGENQLWRNLGGGRFEDITESAGVGLGERISVTAAFADIDNDGDPDLFVTTVKMGNVLFENDGKGHFKEISKTAGVDYVGHSSGAVFFDYDRDGRLDLFVTNVGVYTTDERGRDGYFVGVGNAFGGHLYPERTEASILYRNLGGNRFADVSRQTGLVDASWSGDASAVDLDEDGWLDLYVLNMQGDDHAYLNREGKRFVDETEALFPRSPWGTMGIKFFDYNNNGRMDLVLTDMHSDMTEEIGLEREKLKSRMQWSDETLQGGANNIFGNAFWINQGGGRFEEASDRLGIENYWPWGVSVDDLNADGWDDVLITSSMNFPFHYAVNTLLLNNRGEKFLDAEFLLGIEPRKGGRLTTRWMGLDCAGGDSGHQFCRGKSGPVEVWATLGTRSAVIFDLDDDGDLDIVTNDLNSEPQVLVSDLSEKRPVRFLEVALVGSLSNRDGLGARVRVVMGDRVLTKVHDGKTGYLSQSSLPLYFGLGDAVKVDRVEVTWPNGVQQVIRQGIPVAGRLEIVEEARKELPAE